MYLKRFFTDGIKGDYIFLVDEAHNLVERGREMYSAALVKEEGLGGENRFDMPCLTFYIPYRRRNGKRLAFLGDGL